MPDLRVDAIARLFVRTELTWLDACREVFLHPRLFASKKTRHCDAPESVGFSYNLAAGDIQHGGVLKSEGDGGVKPTVLPVRFQVLQ